MERPLKVTVHYQDDVYHAAVEPDERADQLLLRSLYHFGLDTRKQREFPYRLKLRGVGRTNRGLVLDRPIGNQIHDGDELILEPEPGNRRLSTGHY